MDRNTDEEVRALLSKYSGLSAVEISDEQSLQRDFGVDGDDAVGLFEEFAERFGLDLSSLHSHWADHFGPEGVTLKTSLLWMSVMAPPMFLTIWIGLPPWASFLVSGLVFIVWVGPLRSWPVKSNTRLITVADLLEAAATKRWPVQYEATRHHPR